MRHCNRALITTSATIRESEQMKRKNIKVGDWVVYKLLDAPMEIKEIKSNGRIIADGPDCCSGGLKPRDIRKPRISDLKAGDWFENPKLQGEKYFVQIVYPTGWVKAYMEGGSCYMELEPDTKIRIISLASEKPEAKCIEGDPAEELAEIKAMMQPTASYKLQAEMAVIKAEIEEPEPERKVLKRWVNVWPQEVTRTFHSKSAADENSRWWEGSSTNGMDRIACVEIEIPYYEGEGL